MIRSRAAGFSAPAMRPARPSLRPISPSCPSYRRSSSPVCRHRNVSGKSPPAPATTSPIRRPPSPNAACSRPPLPGHLQRPRRVARPAVRAETPRETPPNPPPAAPPPTPAATPAASPPRPAARARSARRASAPAAKKPPDRASPHAPAPPAPPATAGPMTASARPRAGGQDRAARLPPPSPATARASSGQSRDKNPGGQVSGRAGKTLHPHGARSGVTPASRVRSPRLFHLSRL